MSLPVLFRGAARAEFDDAADWYEGRRPREKGASSGASMPSQQMPSDQDLATGVGLG